MKKILSFTLCLLILFVCVMVIPFNVNADNGAAHKTYTLDANNDFMPTQDAYIAVKKVTSITFSNSENLSLNNPEDIYYESITKKFYIADTANARIIQTDATFTNALEIGKGILAKPQGVFATENLVYVADYGLKAVVIFDLNDLDNPAFIYKPTHPLYVESSSDFLPTKIVVDHVGTMYIIDSGNSNGIVTITKDNEFAGYFGANYVQPDFAYVVKFLFSTKEQRKKLYVSPVSPLNLAIDGDGLINTLSNNDGSAVKKLNIAGNNLLPTNMRDWSDYVDIAIGPTETIYTVEKSGYIVEYDREGNLLFNFAGYDATGVTIGLFRSATSIEVDDEYNLYILDGNQIQVFVQTEFASLIHEALKLYNDGKYQESREPWEKVLQLNNMFDLAHRGLGNAYLREGMYKEAMAEFKLAKDTTSYSNAYWEVRNNWLNDYGYLLFIIIGSLIIILIVLNKLHILDKPKQGLRVVKEKAFKVKLIKEICHLFRFIRHPLDGFYENRRLDAMSVKAATFWYVWFFVLTVLASFFTGFVFNPGDKQSITIVSILLESILPLLLFVICNYLISSIRSGSGRFKDVYINSICCLAPYLLFMPFVIFLSNFVIESEAFFYTLPHLVLWGWSFVLMYFMVKDIQEFNFGENNSNILLTILTMLLFVAFGFLLYMLTKQFINFILDLLREVISRV